MVAGLWGNNLQQGSWLHWDLPATAEPPGTIRALALVAHATAAMLELSFEHHSKGAVSPQCSVRLSDHWDHSTAGPGDSR